MDFTLLTKNIAGKLPPEMAHKMAMMGLKAGAFRPEKRHESPRLKTKVFGLGFENPIGMAAGFDKDAEVVAQLIDVGFGFVEAGTVTPKPQEGNPKPRVFRLPEDQAVINRLGFNSKGLEEFVYNIRTHDTPGIIGANIGKNRETEDALQDYREGFLRVYGKSDYITVNISSPNTPGLRDLQQKDELERLIGALMQERGELTEKSGHKIPLLVKIAPDLDDQQKQDIAEVVKAQQVDGLIISNTTISRPESLKDDCRVEQGGLSGKPLFSLSTTLLQEMYELTDGLIPLIGVGGVSSGFDAYTKIRAGASLVQLYTAVVYEGFGLVNKILGELNMLLEQDGFESVADAVGVDVE